MLSKVKLAELDFIYNVLGRTKILNRSNHIIIKLSLPYNYKLF